MRLSSLLFMLFMTCFTGLATATLACGDKGGDTTGTQTTSGATDTSTGSTTAVTESSGTQPTSSTGAVTTTGETIADVTTDPSTGSTGDTGSTGTSGSTGLETGDTSGSSGSTSADTSSSGGSGGIGENESCQDDPDGCKPGLLCCYPCGIPDCENKCIQPDPQTQMCPLFP
jgi:hypothetical protein